MWPFTPSADYTNKHILITGGSQGIGFALAQQLLALGACVTLVARDVDKLATAKSRLEADSARASPTVRTFAADVTDARGISEAVGSAVASGGPLDLLICNAGVSVPGYFLDQAVELHQRTMSVNYLGCVNTVKAALPAMLERGAGHIVLVSSVAAVAGLVGYTSYTPSKAAVRFLGDCLQHELCGTGLRVSVAYPPDTATEGQKEELKTVPAPTLEASNWPAPSLYTPEEVAKSLIGGMRKGVYHLPSPDVFQNLLVVGMTGVSPKQFPVLLEMLIGFILPAVTAVFAWKFARIMKAHTRLNPELTAAGAAQAAQRTSPKKRS